MASVAPGKRQRLEQPGNTLIERAFPIPAGLVAEGASYPAFPDPGQANDILPKNTFVRLSLNIRIIRLLESGSRSFGVLSTRGWSISLWTAQTDAERCCPPG